MLTSSSSRLTTIRDTVLPDSSTVTSIVVKELDFQSNLNSTKNFPAQNVNYNSSKLTFFYPPLPDMPLNKQNLKKYISNQDNLGSIFFCFWVGLIVVLVLVMMAWSVYDYFTIEKGLFDDDGKPVQLEQEQKKYLTLRQVFLLPEPEQAKYLDMCQQDFEKLLIRERELKLQACISASSTFEQEARLTKKQAGEFFKNLTRALMKPLHTCTFFKHETNFYQNSNTWPPDLEL
ncbi:hypothetical protein ACO0QE_000626 [Hanseniaspora vineae]